MRPRGRAAPAKLYVKAYSMLKKLEASVVHHTVDVPFDLEQLIGCMWSADVIKKLKDAYPLVRTIDRCDFDGGNMPYFLDLQCHFTIKLHSVSMVCPDAKTISWGPGSEIIRNTIQKVHEVHKRFNVVRRVIAWLDDHATPGAARYYFPAICSLLPEDHAVHTTDGQRYREPAVNVAGIISSMRNASVTVASALLCNTEYENMRKNFSVTIYEPDISTSSQSFWLL